MRLAASRDASGAADRHSLFRGTSELAARCRVLDWAATPLGPTTGWPLALRAAVRLVLGAPGAMCVYAGAEYVALYNDAYRRVLGAKHPAALGCPAASVWAEIWPAVGSQYAQVRAGGPGLDLRDVPLTLERLDGGAAEAGWFDHALSPVVEDGTTGEPGAVVAVLSVVTETTARLRAEAAAAAGWERLRALVLQIPIPVALLEGPDHRHALVNDAYRRISGGGRDVTGLTIAEAFPEVAGQGFFERCAAVYATGEPWVARAAPFRYDRDGTGVQETWFDVRLEPVRDVEGRISGVLNCATDVTEHLLAHREALRLLAASEAANAQLADQALELELANQQLQEQQVELEAQTEAQGETAEALRERTEAAERARSALAESEARFRAVADASPDAVLLLRPIRDGATAGEGAGEIVDFEYTYANAPAGGMLGGGRTDALVGKRMLVLFPSSGPEGCFAACARAFETGVPYAREDRYAHEGLDLGIRVAAVRAGDVLHLRIEDIAERLGIDAERGALVGALEVERARLADVFRQAPAFLAVLRGPAHVLDLVNDAYYQLVGHRDIVGKPVLEALPELAGQGYLELLDGVLATGTPFIGREVPVLLARIPGAPVEERFVDLTYLPLVDADGTRAGVIAHGSDVTAQVEARREVERLLGESERAHADAEAARAEADAERRRLALILDRLPVGVVVVDASAAVVHLNPACDAVLGTSLRPVARLEDYPTYGGGLHADGRPYAAGDYPIARAVLEGEVVTQELTRYRRGDGREVMVSISAAPIRDPDGRITYAVAAIEDVSALETARADAQAANRAKGEFLAVMSHELRTPLNAIGGYAELMEMGIRGPVTPQQAEDLGRIQRSQRHLLGLVNEVLNYAKLETGTVRYDAVDLAVCDALAEAEALVAPQARAKGLVLATADCPPDLGVRADAEKLRQVLANLLSNAVKFTEARSGEPGRIAVACQAAGARIRIAVADTGIGIPADQFERIFEPFVQVRAALTRTAEGTGLGLAISRDLARGMGGELTVESSPGVGSTFTLTLPRSRAPGA
jgi:signal transduction histidine kinase